MRNIDRTSRRLRAAAFVAAALTLTTFVGCKKPRPETGSVVGKSAPDFSLKGVDGKPVNLADLEGKVVLIDFWATWCPPCQKGIPELVELQKRYADKGLVVVGLSVDEDWSLVAPFVAKYAMTYPVAPADQKLVKAYDVTQGIPLTFVVDRDGVIQMRQLGYTPAATFEKKIQELF